MLLVIGNACLPGTVSKYVKAVITMAASLLFVMTLTVLASRVDFRNRLFRLLGRVNFEFYLYQGLFILLFRNEWLWIESTLLYVTAVALATLGMAYVMNQLDAKVYAGYAAWIGTKAKTQREVSL